ncbi:HNH endonuclease [Burkholderia cepacia]|uniref:HNH endonuclease n=1 Tax=Burkholderia cepacia TaxID=292 RepID=UPI000F5DDCA5|nr:HNH endonuclease [Burkholderia cepacia]
MRRLDKPKLNPIDVYDDCIRGIGDADLVARFLSSRREIIGKIGEYDVRAAKHDLHSFAPSKWGRKEQVVLGKVSKGEFVDLYVENMAKANSVGRNHYDSIMMTAPLGICPFCGFGHASTLDHFLSKSYYPAFSVLTSNLIPACKDCNVGKSANRLGPRDQMLHPYFEDALIDAKSWLFAEVIEFFPATIRYYIDPPDDLPDDLIGRIRNYFVDLDLGRRFSIQASAEMVDVSDYLSVLVNYGSRRDHLETMAKIERGKRRNSWKAAMYEALLGSNWYIVGGYKNIATAAK